MTERYTRNNLNPSVKHFGELRKEELDLVRADAEQAADRFIQQHRSKPVFLYLVGRMIAAHGKSLEPTQGATDAGGTD